MSGFKTNRIDSHTFVYYTWSGLETGGPTRLGM